MSAAFAKLKSALGTALEKIGNTNGHAYPYQDNTGRMLHDYYVATEGEAFFKKKREAVLKQLKDSGILSNEPDAGSEAIVASTEMYDMSLKKSNPASRVDKALFAGALIKLFGAKPDKVEAFLSSVTKEGEPSRTYRAIPKGTA